MSILSADHPIDVGKIVDAFGIKGWLKVFSYTDPPQQIGSYSPWMVGDHADSYAITDAQIHNRFVIAKLEGVSDRTVAEALCGSKITVTAQQIYEVADGGGYYWFQLIGMRVVNQEGCDLGVVKRIFATGANDVLVVDDQQKTRLIPYVMDEYINDIDTDEQCISVIWQEDW